jgi:hypothetical protein
MRKTLENQNLAAEPLANWLCEWFDKHSPLPIHKPPNRTPPRWLSRL